MRFLRPILYMVFMGAACTGTSEYHKKAPGFSGVRGKRSVMQEEPSPDKDGGTITNEKESNLEIQKRAPPELIGGEELDKPFNGWVQDGNFQAGVFKRAPSVGFFGMRGKKYYYDERPEAEKRARMTNFFGMRGKKQLLIPESFAYPSDKRFAPANSFMGMRGKKLYGQEGDKELSLSGDYIDQDKRAPKYSAGFFGMRGKKDDEEMLDLGSDDTMSEAEKRARNLFWGMRGRRDLGNKEIDDEKRAYNAFFGMRGKRVYEDYLEDPSMQSLYGMRGKKLRGRSNFFGMRGKKLPSEFRGKFVGVRGKKSTKVSDLGPTENEDDPIDLQRVDSNEVGNLMFLMDEDKNSKQREDEYNTLRQDTMTEIN